MKILLLNCFLLMILSSASAQNTTRSFELSFGEEVLKSGNYVNAPRGRSLQDIKRSMCQILVPGAVLADEQPTITTVSGSLINTVNNTYTDDGISNDRSLYIITPTHAFTPEQLVLNATFTVHISFDFEFANAPETVEMIDLLRPYSEALRTHYEVHVKTATYLNGGDLILLKIDLDACRQSWGYDNIFDNPKSPFYNAYAIGWDFDYPVETSDYAVLHHSNTDAARMLPDIDSMRYNFNALATEVAPTPNGSKYFHTYFNDSDGSEATYGGCGGGLINLRSKSLVGLINTCFDNILISGPDVNGLYVAAHRFEALENGFYPTNNGLPTMRSFLDPEDTWLRKSSGGYVRDLLPNSLTEDFEIEIDPGILNQKEGNTSIGSMHHINGVFDFPQHYNNALGAGINLTEGTGTVYLTAVVDDSEYPFLLYAVKAYLTGGTAPNEPFQGEALDPSNPEEAQILSEFSNYEFLKNSSDLKENILQYLAYKARAESVGFQSAVMSNIRSQLPLKIKMFRINDGQIEESKVRAIRLPYNMPHNAMELFEPERLADLWSSAKYRESRGEQSGNLFINAIKVKNGEDHTIFAVLSENNGGYLNLVNRHYYIDPVLTSYIDESFNYDANSIKMTIMDGVGDQPFFYKVWMDFSEGVDAENYYNFVEEGSLSDLIGEGSGTGSVEFEYNMPDNVVLGLDPGESRYVRMRVAISSTNNITQDGIYAQGEVEDYLVKLVAPVMPVLHLADAEPSGAQEVVIDQSELTGISTIGMAGGVASDPWHRRLGENAFHLPNTNDYLSLDDNNQFIHNAFTQRTVAFWLYNEVPTGLQDLYDEGGSTHGFGIRLNAGKPELAVRNNGNLLTISGEHSLPLEEWVHLMGVFAEGNLLLYVNGELVAEATNSSYNQIPYHGDAAAWGATQGANAFSAVNNNFNGWLDDLRVYDVALQQEGLTILLAQATDIINGLELRHLLDNDYTDASGNNITSVAQSGLLFTDVAAQGSHAMFNAEGKCIDIDTGDAFIHDAFNERTIAFWMKSGETSSTQDIFDEGGTTKGIALRINDGQIELAVKQSNQFAMISSCVEGFQWIHVAGVFNNGALQLYVNGELVAENSNVGFTNLGSHGDGAGFGATNGSNAFNEVNNSYWGTLDDLSIYSRALNGGEIQFLMAQADVSPNPDLCGGNPALVSGADGTAEEESSNDRLKESVPTPSSTPLKVYPNPSVDGRFVVTFELDKPNPVQLTIIGLDGRQLVSQTLNPSSAGQQRVQLNQTQGLPPGMYLLRVDFGDHSESSKLIIGN